MPTRDSMVVRGTARSRPTQQQRGLDSASVPNEDALEQWAGAHGYALDFTPQYGPVSSSATDRERWLAPGKILPDDDALRLWARKVGAMLDFDPQYSASPAQKRRVKRGGHARSPAEATQSNPGLTARITSGPGFLFVGTRGQNVARPETLQAVESVGRKWAELHPEGPRIRIGAVGVVYGGPLQRGVDKSGQPVFHKSHQHGIDLDIRPMTNNGREENTEVGAKNYSSTLTKQLIEFFQTQQILKVDWIFFNDRSIPGTTPQDGHSNHFHIRFIPPN